MCDRIKRKAESLFAIKDIQKRNMLTNNIYSKACPCSPEIHRAEAGSKTRKCAFCVLHELEETDHPSVFPAC